MKLPIFQSGGSVLTMLQTRWATILNPVIDSPLNSVNFLTGVVLSTGANVVNHGLGQIPQGWFVTDINGVATIYRSAAFNDTTLTLTASASVTVNLAVF